METANPLSAEGRGSGAQINLLTKSGTNIWHGSASEYNRNTDFEAYTFFNNRTDPVTPRENLIRNQFWRDLWPDRLRRTNCSFSSATTAAGDHTADSSRAHSAPGFVSRGDRIVHQRWCRMHNGEPSHDATRLHNAALTPAQLAAATGGPCNTSPCDPQGLGTNAAFFAFIDGRYPHANDLTVGDGVNTGGFRFDAPAGLTENEYVARVDYNLSSKMRLFGRFSIQRQFEPDDVNFAGAEQFPGDPTTHEIVQNPWAFVIGHTWTISNTKVNQFYGGETRAVLQFPTLFNPNGTTEYSGFGPLTPPFQGQASQGRTVPIPVFRDDFTWTQGKHTWQFGGTFSNRLRVIHRSLMTSMPCRSGSGGGLAKLCLTVSGPPTYLTIPAT